MEDDFEEILTCGDFEYTILDTGTAEITRYMGGEESVNVPQELDGIEVTSIGNYAFEWRDMTSIITPDSVISIGDCTFAECVNLTSIIIPDSVNEIDGNPFRACPDLTLSMSSDHPTFELIDGVLFRKADHTLVYYPITLTSRNFKPKCR